MEEQEKIPGTEEGQNENQNYIDAIAEMRRTTVPKVKYDKLAAENKSLLMSLVNGESVSTETPQEPKRPVEEIVKEMRTAKSDIEYVELALEFRDRVMEDTGDDPFVSRGHSVAPTEESYVQAQKVANVYRECLDYAGGDNKVFMNELQRRMVDSNPMANINKLRR